MFLVCRKSEQTYGLESCYWYLGFVMCFCVRIRHLNKDAASGGAEGAAAPQTFRIPVAAIPAATVNIILDL